MGDGEWDLQRAARPHSTAAPSGVHSTAGHRLVGTIDRGDSRREPEDTRLRSPAHFRALHASLPVIIGGLWSFTIRDLPLRDMSDLGLISVLPVTTLLLLFALTASFCLSLRRRPPGTLVPLLHVLALIVILYGATGFIDSQGRTSTVYRHAGIIDHIMQTESVDPRIDAYFNWPGFFALGVFVTELAGFSSPMALARWGPLSFNLLFLAPLFVIFRWASKDARIVWAGLWVFYSTNWISQDYISPQALGYLLWLSILGALLVTWVPKPTMLAAGWPRRLLQALHPRQLYERMTVRSEDLEARSRAQRVGLLIVVLLIYGAIVTGHQLTPFPVLLTVAGLVLFAGLVTQRLPIIMTILLAAWISYMTTEYLIGNIDTIAGPVGSVGANLNQNVSGRIGGSADHQLIANIRVVVSAAIWGMAFLGLVRRLRAQRADVALAVIGAAPLLLPVMQPYGGEMMLRVFFFTLPAVAFFIASLAFPSPTAGRTGRATALMILGGCGLLWAFQYTRYGNERLDHFTKGDIAAVRALYRAAPPGSQLYAGTHNLPWRYRDYARHQYRSITDTDTWRQSATPNARRLAAELQRKLGRRGGYIIVTRSTKIGAGMLEGKPRALDSLVDTLRSLPSARQVYRGRDGDVFFLSSKA